MEAPPPKPPSGMDYNAFRRWRTDSGIKGTRQELKDAWDAYGTKKVSATREKRTSTARKVKPTSPPRAKTPPLLPPRSPPKPAPKAKSPPKPSPKPVSTKKASPAKSSPPKAKASPVKSPSATVALTNARLFEPKLLKEKGKKASPSTVWQFTFRYGIYAHGRLLDAYNWGTLQPSTLQQRAADAISVMDIIGKVKTLAVSQVRDIGVMTVEFDVADVTTETFIVRVESALRRLEVPLSNSEAGVVPDTLVALIPVEIPETRPYPPEPTSSFQIVTEGYEVEDRTNLLGSGERKAREIVLIPKLVKERLGEPTRYGGRNDDYTTQWVFALDTETLALIDYVVPSESNPPKMSWKQTTPLTFLLSGGTGMTPGVERQLRRMLTRDLTYPPSPTASQAPTLILPTSPTVVSPTSPGRKSPVKGSGTPAGTVKGASPKMPGSRMEVKRLSPTGSRAGSPLSVTLPMSPEETTLPLSRSPRSGIAAPPPSRELTKSPKRGSKSPKRTTTSPKRTTTAPPKRVECSYSDVTLAEVERWHTQQLESLAPGHRLADWSIYTLGATTPTVYVYSSESVDGQEASVETRWVQVVPSGDGYRLQSLVRDGYLADLAGASKAIVTGVQSAPVVLPSLKVLTSILSTRPNCDKDKRYVARSLFSLYKGVFTRLSPALGEIFTRPLQWEDYRANNVMNVIRKLVDSGTDAVMLLAQLRMLVGYFGGLVEPSSVEKSTKVSDVIVTDVASDLREVLVRLQERYVALKRAA
jgi:hypothetical protein